MQGHAVENLDLGTVLDDQGPSSDVETVQLRLGRGDGGQIPAARRRGPRVRLRPSSAPRRARMRLMVRSDGTWATPCSTRVWRMRRPR